MAVTTQKTTEYTNATADPVVNNESTEYQGRLRVMFFTHCLLYTSPSPRDVEESRMPSSA